MKNTSSLENESSENETIEDLTNTDWMFPNNEPGEETGQLYDYD